VHSPKEPCSFFFVWLIGFCIVYLCFPAVIFLGKILLNGLKHFYFFSQVFQLLTDLKQQRKESGKNKQSSGQQNLNTIMYEVSSTVKFFCKLAQAGVFNILRSVY